MSDHLPQSLTPEVVIQSVSFDDDYEALQITYVEERNVGAKGFKVETLTIAASVLEKEELDRVIDSLLSFIDVGLVHLRGEI